MYAYINDYLRKNLLIDERHHKWKLVLTYFCLQNTGFFEMKLYPRDFSDPKLVCLQFFECASSWILLVVFWASGVRAAGFIYVAKRVKQKLWPCLSSLLLPFVLGTLVWCVWAACCYVACPLGIVGLLPSMESLEKEMHELNTGSQTALC